MTYKATKLRQNLYTILDSVIEYGEPIEIERKGHILRIIPDSKLSIWDRLEEHSIVIGDPEELVSMQWEGEWKEGMHFDLP